MYTLIINQDVHPIIKGGRLQHHTYHTHTSPQDAEADLAILIEVRVESHHPTPCGHELHAGRDQGVGRGESNDEVEESTFVGSVKWTSDYYMQLWCSGRECVFVCIRLCV